MCSRHQRVRTVSTRNSSATTPAGAGDTLRAATGARAATTCDACRNECNAFAYFLLLIAAHCSTLTPTGLNTVWFHKPHHDIVQHKTRAAPFPSMPAPPVTAQLLVVQTISRTAAGLDSQRCHATRIVKWQHQLSETLSQARCDTRCWHQASAVHGCATVRKHTCEIMNGARRHDSYYI